jgi:hypothetical protein
MGYTRSAMCPSRNRVSKSMAYHSAWNAFLDIAGGLLAGLLGLVILAAGVIVITLLLSG